MTNQIIISIFPYTGSESQKRNAINEL